MEVLAKRAITLKVSGVLGSLFVSMLLATYNHFWERPILLGANAGGKIEDLVTHF